MSSVKSVTYVSGCTMEQANQKLLGPNGEKLRIVINKPLKSDNCYDDNVIRIPIISKSHRGDATAYTPHFGCATITHEILHLLGLCDEYKEPAIGFHVNSKTGERQYTDSPNARPIDDDYDRFEPAYDCRVLQPDNSVMSSHHERWRFVFKESPRQYALAGKQNRHSLLHPVHFNSILYGECLEKNKVFNECSQLAYVNSFEDESCMEKKRWCESQNLLGFDKQEERTKVRRKMNVLLGHRSFLQNMERGGPEAWEKYFEKGLTTPFMGNNTMIGFGMMGAPAQTSEEYQQLYDFMDARLKFLQESLEIIESWPD